MLSTKHVDNWFHNSNYSKLKRRSLNGFLRESGKKLDGLCILHGLQLPPRGKFPKFLLVLRVIDMSDRNPPITAR